MRACLLMRYSAMAVTVDGIRRCLNSLLPGDPPPYNVGKPPVDLGRARIRVLRLKERPNSTLRAPSRNLGLCCAGMTMATVEKSRHTAAAFDLPANE